jgi:hypothetical protein
MFAKSETGLRRILFPECMMYRHDEALAPESMAAYARSLRYKWTAVACAIYKSRSQAVKQT